MKKHIDTISKTPKTDAAAPAEKPVEPVTEPAVKEEVTPAEVKPEETKAEEPKKEEAPAEADKPTPTEGADGTPPEDGKADSFDAMFPEPNVAISGPPSWIWWVLLLLATAVLAFVGYSMAQGKLRTWLGSSPTPSPSASASVSTTASPSSSASPTATATTTPTPSPTVTGVTKSSITIRVLNGTTVTGAAGKAKSALEDAGFTVRTTGNAQNQTYETTYVYYQTGKSAEAQAVKDALTGYSVTLEESTLANPDNVLVVIGKK